MKLLSFHITNTTNMEEIDLIKNFQNVGMNGVLLIFLFGLYKFLVSRNFISRCGWITVDFRSKELRAQELEYHHLQKMAELEVAKLQATIVNDKYYVTNDKENDQDNKNKVNKVSSSQRSTI
jgi:hypothetical protein